MQKIQRKKDKQLSAKLLIAAAAVFLLLCGGAILLLNRQEKPAPEKEPERDLLLYQKDVSLLSSISLYRGGEWQMTLLYQDGALSLEGRPEYPIKTTSSENLLALAQKLTADEYIMDLPEDPAFSLAPYGLDPAERSAVFRYTDGTEITLSVGSLMPIENPRYYALVSGQKILYSVTQDVRDDISRTLESLHPVDRPQIKSSLLDRITVSGDVSFDAVLTPDGWQMTEPVRYPLSETAFDPLLSQLQNIRFSGWIGYAKDLDLDELGLSPAKRTMTLTFAETVVTAPDESGQDISFSLPSSQMSFSLGNSQSDTGFYLLYEDQVYSGTVLSFSFLKNFSWDKYLLSHPVNVPVQSLCGLVLEQDGRKTDYQISYTERVLQNNQLETDEYGNILYDMHVVLDGKEIDPERFVAWYLSLSAVGGTQRSEEKRLTGADSPLFRLTLRTGDKEEVRERTVTVCPFSAVQDRLYVDGVSLFLMDIGWRDALSAAPSAGETDK